MTYRNGCIRCLHSRCKGCSHGCYTAPSVSYSPCYPSLIPAQIQLRTTGPTCGCPHNPIYVMRDYVGGALYADLVEGALPVRLGHVSLRHVISIRRCLSPFYPLSAQSVRRQLSGQMDGAYRSIYTSGGLTPYTFICGDA